MSLLFLYKYYKSNILPSIVFERFCLQFLKFFSILNIIIMKLPYAEPYRIKMTEEIRQSAPEERAEWIKTVIIICLT